MTSHVSGRCHTANHTLVATAVFALLAVAPAALAADPASDAFDACTNSTSGPAVAASLSALGWQSTSEPLPEGLRDILVEGIVAAMTVDGSNVIDWPSAFAEASDLVAALEQSVPDDIGALLVDPEDAAVLFAADRDDYPGWDTLHCVFGGPVGPDLQIMLDTLARLDERERLEQANPELHIATMQSQRSSETNTDLMVAIDARFGRYVAPLPPDLNREVTAELGISALHFSQR